MKRLRYLPLCLLIAGCQTNGGPSGGAWQNAAIKDAAARERQLIIDNGRCKQASMGSVPQPNIPVSTGAPSSYQVSGTTSSIGGGYQTYNATVTPTPNPGASFAGGFANGMAIRQSIDARNAREEIYKGCMYQLGWTLG